MGAVDAWMEVLMILEDLKLDQKHYCGGTADIAKFFDQVRRQLVYQVARAAGMPAPVLTAYHNYLDNIYVYNCLAGGIGRPYLIALRLLQDLVTRLFCSFYVFFSFCF